MGIVWLRSYANAYLVLSQTYEIVKARFAEEKIFVEVIDALLELDNGRSLREKRRAKGGPGKLPMFGVRENPKICPRIHKLRVLTSGRGCHVITQKGNISVFAPSSCIFVSVLSGHESRARSQIKQFEILKIENSWCVIQCSTSISPQIRKKVDRIGDFGPSNPQKMDKDLTIFRPQIRKIADTNHQELPGACKGRKATGSLNIGRTWAGPLSRTVTHFGTE